MKITRWTAVLLVLVVTLIALGLRLRAVNLLPIDYDEDDYLSAAQYYAQAIREGDIRGVIDYDFNSEHPPLTKILYGLAIMPLPQVERIPELPSSAPIVSALPQPHFTVARLVSAALSTLEVLVVSLLSPLAGLFLAISTWQIKYTSQIMLEPLPALTSLLSVYLYARSGRRWNASLVGAALLLGITVASKYPYGIVGLAMGLDWLLATRPEKGVTPPRRYLAWLGPVVAWGMLAVLAFWMADPRLWADPFSRLSSTILFHGEYAQSEQVRQAGFPPWQPLVWLFGPVPWHPGVFLFPLDVFIAILGLLGFSQLWSKRRVFALWLVLALGFLLLWPTKWPQYVLMLTAPLTLSAAEGARTIVWQPIVRSWQVRRKGRHPASRDLRQAGWRAGLRAVPWLIPGLLVLGLIAIYPMVFQGAMALTDFSTPAIRDGLNGGVWRAVWEGVSGQADPVNIQLFSRSSARQVHYAGPSLFLQLLLGAAPDLVVFGLIWTVLSVLTQTGLGMVVALMLHRQGIRFKGWWRAIFILPWAIPEFVGALIWSQVFDPRFGWAQHAASAWYARADYPGAYNFIAQWQENPGFALVVLLITATWYGFPFMMLAATAGLKMIPQDVYDAADIDGANLWTKFGMITWPLLLPLMVPAIIIRAVFAFNQFYIFYVLQPPYPLATFSIMSFIFFDEAGQYAVSAVLNIFTVVILAGLILWFNRWSKALEGVTYA